MPIYTQENGWVLETNSTGYALGLNKAGLLVNRYWGMRLSYPNDYPAASDAHDWASFTAAGNLLPEEYPAYGGANYIEPCLKATFADGVRDVVWRVVGFDSSEGLEDKTPELRITLRDAHYALRLTLVYRVHEAVDLIERYAILSNEGDSPITLERVFSAQWHVPRGHQYRLTHLSGRWIEEFNLQRDTLTPGVKTIDSRRVTTSHHHAPWFAVDKGSADEDSGDVWFGVLAWSGNWKLTAEMTTFNTTRVSLGVNDWDFAWTLQAGESFTTPQALGGYAWDGFGGASRRLHDYARESLLRPDTQRKVLYNSWEATTFNVDVESQVELAKIAAGMGVELFVMDDGWFKGRKTDNAGLGDWTPDPEKFPNGLNPLIEAVNALGMDFGLWVEPEMVNPDSDLYREHPDWVIHFPNRHRTEMRNQMILNFARPDVQDYILNVLDDLLKHHNIRFIKWDMNRNVSEPGWTDYAAHGAGNARELWVRYTRGLYRVWGELRQRHPDVIWQSCSGGGGRADFGMLPVADQFWISDNTEPAARLRIQEGFSMMLPANTMEAWVTDSGESFLPLQFRFHVSMCGLLGVGGNLHHWTDAMRAEAAEHIALYKQIRHLVQDGDLFRLRSAQDSSYSALMVMDKDRKEGVLFAFCTHRVESVTNWVHSTVNSPPLYLRGLEPDWRYEVEGIDGIRSGMAWMHSGIALPLRNFDSTIRRIRRV